MEFIPMRDIAQMLPPKIQPCNVDWGISVRRELADVVRPLFNGGGVGGLFIDSVHEEFFMRSVFKNRRRIVALVFSPNYLGVTIKPPRELTSDYIIGVNDGRDGLFINELDLTRLHFKSGITGCHSRRGGGIMIATASDDDFRSVLGYNVDVLSQEAVLTAGPKDRVAYRVQGEVVFDLIRADDEYIAELFNTQVVRSISIYMADKVMRLLIDYGFNPYAEVDIDDVHVTIPGALTGISRPPKDESLRDAYRHRIEKRLRGLFVEILGGYFTVEPIGHDSMYVSDGTASAKVEVRVDDSLSSITLHVSAWEAVNTPPTKYVFDRMMSEIINSIKDMLNNSERIDELMIGSHYIKIERGLPINFEYEPLLKPKILENMLISVSQLRAFLVSPRTLVTIEHPQHGSRRLRFDGTYNLRIMTTTVSSDYIEAVNSIILRRLIGKARGQATTAVEG